MSILTQSLAEQLRGEQGEGNASSKDCGVPLEGRSYVRGDTTIALRHVTVSRLLREAVQLRGSADAAIFCQQHLRRSYYEFDRDADDLAAGLLALGLNRGDRIGIWAPNCYEWLLTQFASARIGLILVTVNPAYQRDELAYVLNKVEIKALVTAVSFKTSHYLDMIGDLAPELASCTPGRLQAKAFPHLRSVIAIAENAAPGLFSFAAIKQLGGPAQRARIAAIEAALDPDDIINIQFTSGTTGKPKGAALSHYNIVNNARFVTDRIDLTQEGRLCIPVPLYHCFGMVMGTLGAVSKGAAMIFPAEAFDPQTTLETLSAERCSAVYAVPTMFVGMLRILEKHPFDLSALQTGIMAGAPCPIAIMRQVNDIMNLRKITICYGMTETSPVSFQSFVDDPVNKRCETVGRIHPHLEVKLIDAAGAIIEIGKIGELCTRGYSVMKGYWGETNATQEVVIDGWMHSGDLAQLDAEGFCTIVGRVKDMIIRGGENIYPREIEEFLFRFAEIAEVQVFGVPDDDYGEEVCAWIRPAADIALTPEKVRDFCVGQIAHYKIPRHILLVDAIPMTVTGKPQKFIMRDRMIARLKETVGAS